MSLIARMEDEVKQATLARGFRDEVQHPLRLVGCELPDFAKGWDVPLR